jgi:AraC-like DNA-binding protein
MSAAASLARAPESALIVFEDRPSDSPLVERVWRCHSERAGRFQSVGAGHFEICVTRLRGRVFVTLRGPETSASTADCPAEGEWLGIRFKMGAFMPATPPGMLRDRQDLTLPGTNRSFLLHGSLWEYPDFENAETFVKRLAAAGFLARNPIVSQVLLEQPRTLSTRSAQRHFLRSTGITYTLYRQIERARYATQLLRQGVPILDVVHQTGYFDQAHLTRSLKRFIGETPTGILRARTQLSFLYKTDPAR